MAISETKIEKFVEDLYKLSQKHKLWIWTGLVTNPIMVSSFDEDAKFCYVVERPANDVGTVVMLRRKLLE
jgi:hypothetical protein